MEDCIYIGLNSQRVAAYAPHIALGPCQRELRMRDENSKDDKSIEIGSVTSWCNQLARQLPHKSTAQRHTQL